MSEKEEVFLDLETDQILDIYNNNSNEFLNLSNYEDFLTLSLVISKLKESCCIKTEVIKISTFTVNFLNLI